MRCPSVQSFFVACWIFIAGQRSLRLSFTEWWSGWKSNTMPALGIFSQNLSAEQREFVCVYIYLHTHTHKRPCTHKRTSGNHEKENHGVTPCIIVTSWSKHSKRSNNAVLSCLAVGCWQANCQTWQTNMQLNIRGLWRSGESVLHYCCLFVVSRWSSPESQQ